MDDRLIKIIKVHKQKFIYNLITRLVELQDKIDIQLEYEPDDKLFNELWCVMEEAKDKLKDLFNKV